jgi:hypothetical protein
MPTVAFNVVDHRQDRRGSTLVRKFLLGAYGPQDAAAYDSILRWKLTSSFSILARTGSEIVGHVGILPVALCCKGSCVQSAWSVDTVVLPDWRRAGIGTSLQRMAHDFCPTLISIWMSSENSRIKRRIGATSIGTFVVLSRHVRPEKCSCRVAAASVELMYSSARSYLHDVDFFASRAEDFLRWKFTAQPFSTYRLVGCDYGVAAIRNCGYMRQKSAMIGDAWPKDERLTPKLLKRAAVHLASKNCNSVLFGTANGKLARELMSDGWKPKCQYEILTRHTAFGSAKSSFFSLSDQDMDQYPW